MTITSDPEFVAETLAWCNEKRAEQGKEPLDRLPKGKRTDPLSCPCGRACGLWVGAHWYGETFPAKKLPWSVERFVLSFDSGELPQYDEEVTS